MLTFRTGKDRKREKHIMKYWFAGITHQKIIFTLSFYFGISNRVIWLARDFLTGSLFAVVDLSKIYSKVCLLEASVGL